jgi:ectoine hydroxylase-related dioxygenase (phytanoyl-CoA dioxygenase family)
MNNLGLKKKLLTNLFPQPKSAEEWVQYALSEEQVIQFKQEGYIHRVRLLNEEQMDVLKSQLKEMAQPDHAGHDFFYEYHSNESENPENVLFHALGAWRVRSAYHDLLWNPPFLMAAYQLLGNGFRLFHDQLFSKPAKHGSVVAWHQDYSYWTWTTPMSHLTCWMGLDDVDTENGCMYYVPRSHRWGLLEKKSLAGDMDAIRDALTLEQVREFDNKVPVAMRAGEASFHHPLLMHGSYENRSKRSRRATLINVFSDGVVSNREDDGINAPGADNYPRVPKGQPMGGDYYPLLLDPDKAFEEIKDSIPTIETL